MTLSKIDWNDFKKWLSAQYSVSHAHTILNYAKAYPEASLDASKASQLKALNMDKRRYVMQAMAALSKYNGTYEVWQAVRRQAGLKWERPKAASVVRAILSEESTGAIQWLREALPKLPRQHGVPLVFTALTGLRPSEACNACALVFQLSSEGKLSEYYDEKMNMLQHYRHPKTFLRNTKNAYISFTTKRMIEVVAKTTPVSYNAIQEVLTRRGLTTQTYDLRKYYATTLRRHLDREMIDLLQGRLDASVFVKHYYRPLIRELRDKVLAATRELEKELLPLLEQPATLPSLN